MRRFESRAERRVALSFVGLLLLSVPQVPAEDSPAKKTLDLLQPGNLRPERLKAHDARWRLEKRDGRTGLRLETGTKTPWPGLEWRAPSGGWDFSRFGWISLTVRNAGRHPLRFGWRADNPGADGRRNCVTEAAQLEPGDRATLTVPLTRPLFSPGEVEFVGMRGPPPVVSPLDPARVEKFIFFATRPRHEHVILIESVLAGGRPRLLPDVDKESFFPFVDRFGQFIHAEWPGKTHSEEELRRADAAELEELRRRKEPPKRNCYGGWAAGPKLEATGYFRVTKHGGKWWFVDPEGRLFWSHGIDCVRSHAPTPISGRERYFSWLPRPDSPFARFYGSSSWAPHGWYHNRTPYRTFDFYGANLFRKYGEAWRERFAERAHTRLRSWGFNTIGNWSDRFVTAARRTPYVATLHTRARPIEGSEGYWRQFPDPFDPAFRRNLRRQLEGAAAPLTRDPWCIGFFADNELGWGDETSLAVAALKSPADQPAKKAFLEYLQGRYQSVEKLNAAWGTSYKDWAALRDAQEAPDPQSGAREDLEAFYTVIAEAYFRTIREELRRAAPHHLYLGCRFAWVNDRAVRAAAKYCDVISYNKYTYSVERFRLPEGIDRPVIIGEFHFGALDRGLFHTGLRKARDQEHRAELYRGYVTGALRNPWIVGTHWFQYMDQPVTGRADGENYQIGFVDVCDRPYPEIVAAARAVGELLYRIRAEGAP